MGGERQLKVFRKVGKVCVKEMNASEPFAGCAVYRWHELDMGSLEE